MYFILRFHSYKNGEHSLLEKLDMQTGTWKSFDYFYREIEVLATETTSTSEITIILASSK